MMMAAKILCMEHTDCELDYYCKSCEESVCMFCALTKHAGHCYSTAEQMVAKHKDDIKQTSAALDKIANGITETLKHIDKMKTKQSDALDEIDRYYEEQIRKLMEQKEQAKAQFCDQASKKVEAYNAQQKELEVIQKEVTRLNEVLENSSGKEMPFSAVKKQKEVVNDCMQEVDAKWRKIDSQLTQLNRSFVSTVDPRPLKQSAFDPAYSELLFPENLNAGQFVTALLCTRDSLGNLCTHCSDAAVDNEVCVKLESSTGKVVFAKVEDNNDGSYKVTFTPQHIGKAKLIVSINGRHVKGSPYDVTVNCGYDSVYINTINMGGGSRDTKQLWKIAIGRCGIWAVTDYNNHCVYLLSNVRQQRDCQPQKLKMLGNQGNNDSQFQNPHGVAFDSNNNLYVVDGNNHRIQKFDLRGNYLLQFGNKGNGVGQLSNPRGITIHNGRVYVADSGNKRIAVFQTTGQFCYNIGEQLLGVPCDVVVNAKTDTLLVAVYGQNCLNAFTLDGQSKGNFGTLQQSRRNFGTLQLNSKDNNSSIYPYSLATDLNGFVIASETCTQHIEVFDKDGNLVKSLAYSNGHLPGHSVPYPLGVAVSFEGKIWVASGKPASIQKLIEDDFPMQ